MDKLVRSSTLITEDLEFLDTVYNYSAYLGHFLSTDHTFTSERDVGFDILVAVCGAECIGQ